MHYPPDSLRADLDVLGRLLALVELDIPTKPIDERKLLIRACTRMHKMKMCLEAACLSQSESIREVRS